jgi:hypothetical protein
VPSVRRPLVRNATPYFFTSRPERKICSHLIHGVLFAATSEKTPMKSVIILICSLFLLAGCAREIKVNASDVPSVVIASFNARYPEAQEVKWSAEDEKGFYFEADFKVGGVQKSAEFKTDGTFVEEEAKK